MSAEKPIAFGDLEIYPNFLYVGFKRPSDGKRVGVEWSTRQPDFDRARLRRIMLGHTVVGFNFQGFDNPLIWAAIEGASLARVKALADGIIQNRIRWWDAPDFCGVTIPRACDSIDLIEPQPNAIAGLKSLIARLGGKRLQELPYQPDRILTPYEMDQVIEYNQLGDLDGTELLWNALKEAMELRVALGKEYGMDFRSKSDSQVGEAIVKKRVEQITGKKPQKVEVKGGTTFKYPIPDFMQFETPQLKAVLDRLRETEFVVRPDGKVDLPKWLSDSKITIGQSTYQMGIGGLHSTESNRSVHSDNAYVLIDGDVASMYPTLILMLKLMPPALGEAFWVAYAKIKDDRLKAKKRGKEVKEALKDKALAEVDRHRLFGELLACEVADKGLKIALNGIFGKLGSRYSIVYAPQLLIAVTLTGQLSLLMLIERAVKAGIDVASGNTDGVLFKCPRDLFDGFIMKDGKPTDRLAPSPLEDICSQWEQETGMDLEFVEYKAVYNQSVNSYIAIKADGGHKRKGPLANPWSQHPDDRDPRGQLMKNPQATICSDAVLALIKDGTPIEDTIYNCTDIRQFVTVIKADGGATWRGQYLGKVVRYYWSTDGEPIFKSKGHHVTGNKPMVPKTEGSAPCMMLPDDLPNDIDYARYVAEAKSILVDIGYSERPPEPIKLPRLTKANTLPLMLMWATASVL